MSIDVLTEWDVVLFEVMILIIVVVIIAMLLR
jgi:hypothetical protein